MSTLRASALVLSLLAGGCMSPVVGAGCRAGLVECNGRCVDTSSDEAHCGFCNLACGTDAVCVAGVCSASSVTDAGGAPADASMPTDGGVPLPLVIDVPPSRTWRAPEWNARDAETCGLGELLCGGACVRAGRDREHCGACDHACGAGEVCARGACAPTCEAPLSSCGSLCVDTANDPHHCGGCNTACESGICRAGACEGPIAGHVVVVGHDYAVRRPAMSRVVGNAVFMPPRSEVFVTVFEGASSPASRAGTDAAIDAMGDALGREWLRASSTAERVSYELASADVLLVYAQPELASDMALALGRAWSQAIEAFLARGGIVVVMVGPGVSGGSLAILEGAGLVDGAPGRTDVTGEVLQVERPSDAVAVGVPLTYRAEATTVRMDLPLEDAVVSDGLGPVVLHRVIVAPRR